MSEQQPGDRAAPSNRPSIIEAIRFDMMRLHEAWMELFFPRQRDAKHSVLGKWKPQTVSGKLAYNSWALVGLLVLLIVYPLVVLGFATRFYTRRINRSAARIGIIGVFVLSVLVWGGLTILARFRFSYEGFVAVGAAGGVATISALLAFGFARINGRATTVIFAYPFAVTAIFLPPVVAALYSPSLADVVFSRSDLLAIWLLDNVLTIGGINTYLRSNFDLVGLAYVGMWFGLAVPVGWVLGLLVTLANVVRP